MARVVLMEPSGSGLEAALGAQRATALHRELAARAERWAIDVVGESGWAWADPSALAATLERVFAEGGAPVLVAWPELPVWRPVHGEGALDDLADGCDVSLGPMFDGGFYLLALARPVASLMALPVDKWRSPDALALAADSAADVGAGVGLLRAERGLRSPEDVQALLADPLLDSGLRRLLG